MARRPEGRFLGIPYNWKRPSRTDLARGIWDREDRRVFPPKVYGWGYGINVNALLRRLTRR